MNDFNMFTDLIEEKVMQRIKSHANELAQNVTQTLRQEVEETVYEAYDPKHYQRTNALIDSIESKVTIEGSNKLRLGAIFSTDEDYSHTALLNTPRLGISAGDPVYIAEWVNEGYTWRGQDYGEKKPTHFIENTYAEITTGNNSIIEKIQELLK